MFVQFYENTFGELQWQVAMVFTSLHEALKRVWNKKVTKGYFLLDIPPSNEKHLAAYNSLYQYLTLFTLVRNPENDKGKQHGENWQQTRSNSLSSES